MVRTPIMGKDQVISILAGALLWRLGRAGRCPEEAGPPYVRECSLTFPSLFHFCTFFLLPLCILFLLSACLHAGLPSSPSHFLSPPIISHPGLVAAHDLVVT